MDRGFLGPDAVRAAVVDHRHAGLDDAEVAVMDLAAKIVDDATTVEEADFDRLRSLGLSDEEILDMVLAAAVRCFFSKVLDALAVAPDEKYSELDPALRVGR
jgi:alkylhydroperoxidase family enzyme